MPISTEFIAQTEKLAAFFKSPEGNLLLDSIEGYGQMAVTFVNPPLGLAWSMASILTDIEQGDTLGALQKIIEHGIAKKFPLVGEIAIIKTKQLWGLVQIPQVQQAFAGFIKEHIFQHGYSSYRLLQNTAQSFPVYFNDNIIPNIGTYFRKAADQYISATRNIDAANTLLDVANMKAAINEILSEKTIAGLDLNFGIDYKSVLTPDILSKFNGCVDGTLAAGVNRFGDLVSDKSIGIIDYTSGQCYAGKISVNGAPDGKGMLISTAKYQHAVWKDGVKVSDNLLNRGMAMIQVIGTLVSIVAGIFSIANSNNDQAKHLENIKKNVEQIHKLMGVILVQLQKVGEEIKEQIQTGFDKDNMEDTLALATGAINSLAGITGYKNRDDIARMLHHARLQIITGLDRVTYNSPQGNDKLAFMPVIYLCAKNLVSVTLLEFLYFPEERRKSMEILLLDIITRLDSYIKKIPATIDKRFGEVWVSENKKQDMV